MNRISIAVGLGGWVEARWRPQAAEMPKHAAFVRFELVDEKRWRIVEVRMLDPTQEGLRSLPLNRIEHAANASGVVALGLAIGHTQVPPDDLAGHFQRGRPTKRFVLTRPTGRRLPPEFYADVARAYRDAVAAGLNPRKTLAMDSATPADTVARWIGESRRRGYLPTGESGKVTVDAPPVEGAGSRGK